ncbi:AIM24 family protein [bacterium]|nr:AIM24 family protein [bacterium]
MKLFLALVRWLFSRLLILLCIAALVVLIAIFSDWWKQRKAEELQLQALQTQLGELNRRIQERRADLSLEKRYLRLREQEPSRWTSPFQWLQWKKEIEMTGVLIDKKNAELQRLRHGKEKLVQEIEIAGRTLYHTQQLLLKTLRNSVTTILVLCVLVFLGPLCWRAFWYFCVAGLAKHASAVQLEKNGDAENVSVKQSQKNLPVQLQPGEMLVTRMAWLHQYAPTARKKTRFLLNWNSPFTSYAAGLAELTEVSVPSDAAPTEIVLTSGENPDTYICEVLLDNHRGIVVYPSQVVALTGNLQLKTRWTLLNPHSWIAGRLRYIHFSGTGKLFIQGRGGVDAVKLNGQAVRISESILTAFETTLSFSTARTETFWPYYRGMTPLFDYQFEGNGLILRQTAPPSKTSDSAAVRFFDALLNGIGKLLGF